MNRLPSISIVIPSLNQVHYLREALDSIFRQNYPQLEVIVMDGGSTDGSVDVIRSYEPCLSYWQSKPDGGQSDAINEGMSRCTGDLIAWLNSDDYYWGDALWTIARAYIAHSGYGLYIGNGFCYKQAENRHTPFCQRHLALNRKALIEGLDYVLQPSTFFLRQAWEKVGGLNPAFHFCMDWDIVIRIAMQYPAVLINDFLAVSREYEDTKTSTGKIKRMIEICQMIQKHTQDEMTPGTLYFALETLLNVTKTNYPEQLSRHLYEAILAVQHQFAERFGNSDGFPSIGDPHDKYFLPIPTESDQFHRHRPKTTNLPSISIVTPSYNQAPFLSQTLDSILAQSYPKIELIVMDGGSTDGSVDVLHRYKDCISYWASEKDRGPAHAINKGFAIAKGEVVAWLNSDDMISSDALWEVGKAFAEDSELDMIFANALYIDENNELYLADHGRYKTGLYYGEMQPVDLIPAYWSYVHSVPQPTVFFRRRLLDLCGPLNESFHFIFDFELFWRFSRKAKIRKLERTQAFYRIHKAAKTSSWDKFLIELYRFSRPLWPSIWSRQFIQTLRDFVSSFMLRKYGFSPNNLRRKLTAALVGLSALTRFGNPEAMRLPFIRRPQPAISSPEPIFTQHSLPVEKTSQSKYNIDRSNLLYQSIFCSFLWPRHPGHSGGEIRDFHLLRRLLSISRVDFFALYDVHDDERYDQLAPFLDSLHTPKSTSDKRPDLLSPVTLRNTFVNRLMDMLQRNNMPIVGRRYHHDVHVRLPHIRAYSSGLLQETLRTKQPDFLFVSPQSNPVAMTLSMSGINTRIIMASYDVESVRMRRLAASLSGLNRIAMSLEARRADRFERENLTACDGIIAVSELDKEIFVRDYHFEPERVLSIENGVDPFYFSYTERQPSDNPQIVYVGSLGYQPNHQAALRLVRDIMPLVRKRYPKACVWIVGQGPDQNLIHQSDGILTIVTGKVEDVRPYLAMASIACIPLIAGSGTKYKVLEAMSAGVPVVCTPLASEGLDLEHGKHLLLGHTDTELSAAMVQILDNRNLADKLAKQARYHVEKKYSWDVNLVCLDGWLARLSKMDRRCNKTLIMK